MKENDIISGFRVIRARESRELKGSLIEMEHMKTGAKLAWLDNKCENKLFSVTFKTLPWDDTGVFHILEHSVLSGSDHYPVKEPFLDLIKSSMNTYLNALTFSDKTMFPVSSKNEQDFINLTRVYLDAVFHPAIYHNDSIFLQEGWHYEVEDGEVFYNGVVFNEMKGDFSSVDTLMESALMKALYPDTIYRFVSGGKPGSITDLTYENFLKAHRDFYTASNCRFYLDGDIPLKEVLSIIDGEYLSAFERNEVTHEIPLQEPVKAGDFTEYYEIGQDEDLSKKSHLVLGKVFSDWQQRPRNIAFNLISTYLAGDNESPLKRAVLEKGLAQDVEFGVTDGIAQPFYSLVFRNMDMADKDRILEVYRDTLLEISEKGVDKEALIGGLNRLEFSLREAEEPAGLTRAFKAMNSWLYGGDPMLYLESGDILSDLRKALDTDFYDKIIRELLEEEDLVTISLLPSPDKGMEEAEKEYEKAAGTYAALTEEELKKTQEAYTRMCDWQNTPDKPEAIASLPVLKLSDLSPSPQWIEPEIKEISGVTYLFEPIFTNGVVHVNLYFNLSDLNVEELQMMSVMTGVLGLLPTSAHTAAQLQKETDKIFGGLDYNVIAAPVLNHPDRVKALFTVNFSVLEENLEPAIDLVLEILTDTDFNNKETLMENLLQAREIMFQSIINSGDQFAVRRSLAGWAASSYIDEKISGYDLYRFVKDLVPRFEKKPDACIDTWQALAARVFTSARLMAGETSVAMHPGLERLAHALPVGETVPVYKVVTPAGGKSKEAILIPANISYSAMGTSMLRHGFTYGGNFQVLSQIMSYGYLWEEIRVRGGAYGCGFNAGLTGNMVFSSYRDPDPMHSIGVYSHAGDFIREFTLSDQNLSNYIISSIAGMDGLSSTARRGYVQELNYIRGFGYDDLCRIRRQMLTLTSKDLASLADLFDQTAPESPICVIGNSDALETDDSWQVYTL